MGWLWDMSYARWLSEAMYTEEILPYAGIYEVYKVSEPQFGYTLGRFGQDCGILFLIIFIYYLFIYVYFLRSN
jgi:hypothetical protein